MRKTEGGWQKAAGGGRAQKKAGAWRAREGRSSPPAVGGKGGRLATRRANPFQHPTVHTPPAAAQKDAVCAHAAASSRSAAGA